MVCWPPLFVVDLFTIRPCLLTYNPFGQVVSSIVENFPSFHIFPNDYILDNISGQNPTSGHLIFSLIFTDSVSFEFLVPYNDKKTWD